MLFKRIGVTQMGVQDYLAVSAILSATDSVCTLQVLSQDETPFLYSIVFGEGVVNDATSIVLINAIHTDFSDLTAMTALSLLGTFLYLLSTSTLLGIGVGPLSALIIKTLYIGRHSTDREIAIIMLMAYISYMIAELINLSGILTVFFCGVVMSHYTWHNITKAKRCITFQFSAGTLIAVSATMMAMVLIGRVAVVFSLANIQNYLRKREAEKISICKQFIIWWAGLMRGAVTVALSYNKFSDSDESTVKENSLMITSTIIVVLFSTVVFGSITKP